MHESKSLTRNNYHRGNRTEDRNVLFKISDGLCSHSGNTSRNARCNSIIALQLSKQHLSAIFIVHVVA